VSVGGPFFNQMTLPVIVVVLFLLGVGPALPWRRTDRAELKRRLFAPTAGLVVAILGALVAGTRDPFAQLAFGFGAFALVSNLQEFWIGTRARMHAHGEHAGAALGRLIAANRHRYGGYLAHIGLVVSVLGIAASSTFQTAREITLAPGDSVTVSGRVFRLERVWGRQEMGRTSIGADIALVVGGRVAAHLEPEQHFYESSDTPVPTPDVHSTAARDLYVNLMAFKEDGSSATIRVLVEPLVMWIWLGGGIVCLGALVALWPRRRRAAPVLAHALPPRTAPTRRAATGRVPAEVTP
jgi:cytochrome c-type biogenesis protein CcmF